MEPRENWIWRESFSSPFGSKTENVAGIESISDQNFQAFKKGNWVLKTLATSCLWYPLFMEAKKAKSINGEVPLNGQDDKEVCKGDSNYANKHKQNNHYTKVVNTLKSSDGKGGQQGWKDLSNVSLPSYSEGVN
ncbi:hypothetical protein HPP92_006907 [Vanilla planifolia]|uniref:Uncharacterized protein n=1 Tax=Vanilla planifolia TaxID=51239 RepID=A0A835V775_VANPL|nr:hypothetical protein HPP92_006907 [Vanilla planifolia]